MMTRTMRTTMTSGLLVAMIAGSTAAIAAAPENQPQRRQQQRYGDRDTSRTAVTHFVRSDALIGSDVTNNSGETLGSIEDFIVDRGSGRIAFAVIRSGDFLGMGGRAFAVPYNQFALRTDKAALRLDMTKEQAGRQVDFTPDTWNDLAQTDWMSRVTGWNRDDSHDTAAEEKVRRAMKDHKPTTIEGRITGVDRRGVLTEEDTVITVLGDDGQSREVVVGPSWYVMGLDGAPARGDEVEIKAVECDGRLVATSAEIDGTNVNLRHDDGAAAWSSKDGNSAPRYIPLTDFVGSSVEIDGSTSGEVQTAVVEGSSGRVAMIGLDPNENFLGLADTIVLVPWSVLSVAPDMRVSLDVGSAKLESAEKMPDDLSQLSQSRVNTVYTAFGVQAPSFDARSPEGHVSMRHPEQGANRQSGDAWGRDSELVKALRDGEKVELTGTVRGVSTTGIHPGAPDARVLTIDTDSGAREIILGPDWYLSRQQIDLSRGDRVTVTGRTAEYNGRQWVGAWKVTRKNDTWTLWNGSNPAWGE